MDSDTAAFLTWLKEARKARAYTQDELAATLKVSRPFVTQVEAGTSPMPVDRLMAWSAALGLDHEAQHRGLLLWARMHSAAHGRRLADAVMAALYPVYE